MTTAEYERLAMRTEADQEKILNRLSNLGVEAMRLDNAARGLAGDAGEVSSAVMRFIEYGRDLDVVNLKEEVGDCLWRLVQVCKGAGFTLTEAMVANIAKLSARYPDKYSDEQGTEENRDRKKERAAIKSVANKVRDTIQANFKKAHDIESCTCLILDFDWPNPTVRLDRDCPLHRVSAE